MNTPCSYDDIIALGEKLNRPTETLLALARQNDPFNADRPARRQAAEWFAALWDRLGFGSGTHLRRVHYQLVSQAKPVRHDTGERYRNTDRSWGKLVSAARDARYLGLVPIGHFEDRRNDDVIEHLLVGQSAATLSVQEPWFLAAQPFREQLDNWLPSSPKFDFEPATVDQRYHVELWAEKTTMNDILTALAVRYRLNVVTASGEISVTHCYRLVQRAIEIHRPVRILYISDFDPAGMSIPVACARKLEYFISRDDLDIDVQVRPVALTHAQCIEYRLPRTPIKATEKRAAGFEERFGEGATELDALEALHSGALRDILVEEISRYYDDDLDDRVESEAQAFWGELAMIRDEIIKRHAVEREAISEDYKALIQELNPELAALAERYRQKYDEISDRFEQLQKTIAEELEDEAPDVESIEWPEPDEGDEDDDPLFDSTRDYIEQIDRFKTHQGKPTARRNGGKP